MRAAFDDIALEKDLKKLKEIWINIKMYKN